jgi:hypothetical protein
MAQTLTDLLKMIKNDNDENVLISEINAALDKIDNRFFPAAKMTRATATIQSVNTGTVTKINFDTVQYDTFAARSEGAMASIANDEFTIRKAGIYLCEGSTNWSGNANGYRSIRILKNGTTQLPTYDPPSSAFSTTSKVAKPYLLAVNDVISFHVFQSSGVSLSMDNDGYPDTIAASVSWIGAAVEV